ncbi:MAG: hypothetical protein IKF68_07475, partial [Erysipelotrichaceae bacterium]|nr:hypothetical protein [Erysipelotrichaceae bacterium]
MRTNTAHQPFIDVEHTLNLVLKQPSGIVVNRVVLDHFKERNDVQLSGPYVVVDFVSGESPGHCSEIVAAVDTFDEGGFGVFAEVSEISLQHLLLMLLVLGMGKKPNQLPDLVIYRQLVIGASAVLDDVMQETCRNDLVLPDVHGQA